MSPSTEGMWDAAAKFRFCLEMGWQVMDRAWPPCHRESPGSAKARIASQLWHARTVGKMLVW